MDEDSHARDGIAQRDRTSGAGSDGPTRRSFLTTSLAGSALVSSAGVVAGQSTETPSGPAAPTNLETALVSGGYTVGLTWEAPADPCEGAIDHYVVTVDGSEEATVPAGVTHASVGASEGNNVFGVRAVDESGASSSTTTTGQLVYRYEPEPSVQTRTSADAIAPGETASIDVRLSEATTLDHPPAFEVTVSLSAPCVARITDATLAEPYRTTTVSYDPDEHASVSIADDGSSVTVAVTRSSSLRLDSSAIQPLASVEVEGESPGHVQADVEVTSLTTADGDSIEATPWPGSLAVEATGPPAPLNVSASQAATNSVDVSWTGVADPCSTTVDHYVVSVDGSDEETVPAGVTRANVYKSAGDYTVGVRAVDEQGNESRTLTDEVSVATSDPLVFFSAGASPGTIPPGETASIDLELSPGPFANDAGISETTVSVSTPCVLSITDVTFGDGAPNGATVEVADDGASATLSPGEGAFTDSFATVEVTGQAEGAAQISATGPAETPNISTTTTVDAWTNVTVSEAAARPPAVGDNEARPRDPDDDGQYEDVNGNGEQEIADAGDLFQHRESDAVASNVDAYDFSGNDEVDLADVVDLLAENT